MTFSDDLRRFQLLCHDRTDGVFTGAVQLAHDSIQNGSLITAAPGQPVDTGALRASWQVDYDSPDRATISTNLPYAEPIENGIGRYGPLKLRSKVGGFHSVALTRAGWPRIISAVVREVRTRG